MANVEVHGGRLNSFVDIYPNVFPLCATTCLRSCCSSAGEARLVSLSTREAADQHCHGSRQPWFPSIPLSSLFCDKRQLFLPCTVSVLDVNDSVCQTFFPWNYNLALKDLWVIFSLHWIKKLVDSHKHTHNLQTKANTLVIRDDEPCSNLVNHSAMTNTYKSLIFRTRPPKSPSSANTVSQSRR